ncbi:hypothetical protein [Granulicoccus sp. GXG6511]|uniref:hypothetical protein n=1 Tax=Granulicoccus sp. GXG6511 TaxID=3381351 RepID=UPI003D7D3DAF
MNELVPVEMPSPDTMAAPWAVAAALNTLRGWGEDDCNALGGDFWFHDGGGNWCKLFRFADGRAVLIGHDHEYSETYFAEAAEYFEEPATDLLAGAPDWWAGVVRDQALRGDMPWVGFIYGWDGAAWSRAAYELDDGLTSLNPPIVRDRVLDQLHEEFPDAGTETCTALLDAAPNITRAHLEALGTLSELFDDAVAVSRLFAGPGRR